MRVLRVFGVLESSIGGQDEREMWGNVCSEAYNGALGSIFKSWFKVHGKKSKFEVQDFSVWVPHEANSESKRKEKSLNPCFVICRV